MLDLQQLEIVQFLSLPRKRFHMMVAMMIVDYDVAKQLYKENFHLALVQLISNQ